MFPRLGSSSIFFSLLRHQSRRLAILIISFFLLLSYLPLLLDVTKQIMHITHIVKLFVGPSNLHIIFIFLDPHLWELFSLFFSLQKNLTLVIVIFTSFVNNIAFGQRTQFYTDFKSSHKQNEVKHKTKDGDKQCWTFELNTAFLGAQKLQIQLDSTRLNCRWLPLACRRWKLQQITLLIAVFINFFSRLSEGKFF